ncbi:glutamate receptor-interacting protein 1-like isoform X3 [Tachypleus tridentatus]|uniref:glutamate receptor-interacting protein 1-like isoform X3 n=1 Tax=Tachypleus tridentatus TaxID=6853 RepID=UPI003FD364C9
MPSWSAGCFKPQEKRQREDGIQFRKHLAPHDPAGALDKRLSFISEEKRGTSIVELVKKEGSTLGLIISGGIDKGSRPKVANLRPGSIAHRSDGLAVGDYIISVNGIRTSRLKHEEIVNLLKNAGEKVTLEVEYEIPASPAEGSVCMCPKVIQVSLEKEDGSFGFTLRGGACSDKLKCRPVTITHVRPGGPADRDGTIKAGDRLLAVNNINLGQATLQDAMTVLKHMDKQVLLTVEYDVSVMDAVRNASGPLLVEIEKTPGTQLGISLTRIQQPENVMVIESIKQATVAERCGALHVGDHILAIDNTRVDQMTAAEATQLLKTSLGEVTRLEILPISQMGLKNVPSVNIRRGQLPIPLSSTVQYGYSSSSYNTLSSSEGHSTMSSTNHALVSSFLPPQGHWTLPTGSLSSNNVRAVTSAGHLFHTDTTQVTIQADHRGFGFTVQGSTFTTELVSSPSLVSHIEHSGPAERSGILHAGDRILAVNSQSTLGMTAEEVTSLIQYSLPRVILNIEFDVAESVVPSSGTFTIKLPKHGTGLGITIAAQRNRKQGDPLIISDIKKGSIAHRTGTLQPGDKLLAINAIRMDNCTIEDAAEILMAAEDVVKLRIRKDETYSEDPEESGVVIYTVELLRHGGPLGITISGTEDPFDPILISGLTEGGLAERTGAIHVGDRLLAINGQSLRGKPLSDAIFMLQNSGNAVTLKICKQPGDNYQLSRREKTECSMLQALPPDSDSYPSSFQSPPPSVDSAVELWDSSGLEMPVSGVRNNQTPQSDRKVSKALTTHSLFADINKNGNGGPHGRPSLKVDTASAWEDHSHISSHSLISEGDNKSDWSKVLEDLETCGQSELLRQIEESILGGDPTGMLNQHFDFKDPVELQSEDDMYKSKPVTVSEIPLVETDTQGRLFFTDLPDENSSLQCSHSNTLLHSFVSQNTEHQQCIEDDNFLHSSYEASAVTSVPVEIHRVTLFKDAVHDDFGFSVSEGLFDGGVYVNCVRPGGPADLSGLIKPLDRILQLNDTKVCNSDCCTVVPMIASAGEQLHLIISRPAYKQQVASDQWADVCQPDQHSPAESSHLVTKTL